MTDTKKDTKPTLPPNMYSETVESLGIEDLIEVGLYNTAADIDADGGPGTAGRLANLYMRQKGSLVRGRRAIVAKLIELTQFGWDPAKKKTKTVEGKSVEYNSETEGEWMTRFKKAALQPGGPTIPGFTITDEGTFEAAVISVSRQLGPFLVSAKAAVREAKEKTPPEYALNGAKSIIANGSQQKWVDTFTKGDKLAGPVQFKSFVQTPQSGEVAEAYDIAGASVTMLPTEHANLINLAWAIKAREDDKRARQAKKEYV